MAGWPASHDFAVIRDATPADAEAIAAIYNEGIEDRQATFETELRDGAYFGDGIAAARVRPFLVYEDAGRVVGWARALVYNWRAAYRGVGEASLYIARDARGRGIGGELLRALEEACEHAGYWKLIGLIFPENRASVALFERAGWRDVGTFVHHGQLDGEWRDVWLAEKLMGPALRSR